MTTMADRDGFIWYDGELVPWRDATTHVLTYTLHYGAGVFEGVRAYATPKGTAVFRLEEHTRRLFNSAKILGMKIPFTPEQVNEATLEVLRQRAALPGPHGKAEAGSDILAQTLLRELSTP